mmetsp:Transcript_6429/g.17981  ORF Transcript_6429/g.17981 Transcript_6429/m.17981 type:complete len:658 (-) Transcript_6429:58-2031(-)
MAMLRSCHTKPQPQLRGLLRAASRQPSRQIPLHGRQLSRRVRVASHHSSDSPRFRPKALADTARAAEAVELDDRDFPIPSRTSDDIASLEVNDSLRNGQLEESGAHPEVCLSVIDMGSNSFHLVVVRAKADGQMEFLDQMKEGVRLLEGSGNSSLITEEAMQRAIDSLQRLKKAADTRNAAVRVIATSAMREATNSEELARRVQDEVGLEVEIISGQEEARLIYTGVLQGLSLFDKRVMCLDIGGGSTELCIGKAGRPFLATSIPLGHLRLKERCFPCDTISSKEIWECQRVIRGGIADGGLVRKSSVWGGGEVIVGCSGTIERCGELIAAAKAEQGAQVSPTTIHMLDLMELVSSLLSARTKEERLKLPGMTEKRESTIVPGALLLLELFKALSIRVMKVSPTALREGAVVDAVSSLMPSFQPFTDVRSDSVAHLAERFDVVGGYNSSKHSAKLAAMILKGFQGLCSPGSPVHSLTSRDAGLLMAGIHLHKVGLYLGHRTNHKHAYYIVRNSELLLGFSPMEVEVIALLTRFHRKKAPSCKDAELKKLPRVLRQKVLLMIALVRMSVALDRRSTAGAVNCIHCSLRPDGALQLLLVPDRDVLAEEPGLADVSLEAACAEQELKFLSKCLKQQVMIQAPFLGECWGALEPPRSKDGP